MDTQPEHDRLYCHRLIRWRIGPWATASILQETNGFSGVRRRRKVDEWRDAGRTYPSDWWLDSSIGVSRFLTEPYTPDQPGERAPRKIASVRSPQTMIFCQDAAEQRMEGEEDSTGLFPGYSEILVQWKYSLAGLYPGFNWEWEWYRHNKKSQVLWLNGNVSRVPYNGKKGHDYRWYTGDPPLQQPRF